MIKSKKQMFLVISIFALIIFIGGITYAWFNYRGETSEQELIAGEIYMNLTEGNEEIELTNVFPETPTEARARNDNFITFEITGKNTSTKTIYYEFILDHGTDKASPKTRYSDADLRFDLVELDSNGNEVSYLLSNVGYNTLINKRIYVDTVDANTSSEVSRKYKLRMWLSDTVIISDTEPNANYNTTEYKNKYATVKLTVSGDFQEKSMGAFYDIKKNVMTPSNPINFANVSSPSNGQGLYILPGTENDTYPIYYYRGNINNNNVIFGDFCWQIVRTTDTGGIKMIYNGEVTGNGATCENTLHANRVLSNSSPFNSQYQSVADVGYMKNARKIDANAAGETGSIYGKNVEWDGTKLFSDRRYSERSINEYNKR